MANRDERDNEIISQDAAQKRESGEPGGGAGRRDDVGHSGVYPVSGDERPPLDGELLKRIAEEKQKGRGSTVEGRDRACT